MNDPPFPDTAPHGPEIDDCPPVAACVRVLADAFGPLAGDLLDLRQLVRHQGEMVRRHPVRRCHRSRMVPLRLGRGRRPPHCGRRPHPARTSAPTCRAGAVGGPYARVLRPRSVRRTLRYLGLTEAGARGNAWTLEFIGVVSAAAGRGAGRRPFGRLPADTPAMAGIYLTTADPGNVALYQHFGFVTQQRLSVGPMNVATLARR